MSAQGDLLHTVTADTISDARRRLGKTMVWGAALLVVVLAAIQMAHDTGRLSFGFENWRPVLYAYVLWAFALCAAQVIVNGEKGKRTLFVLPAALFVISLVVFPLLFALYISFTDWNLASPNGPQ
ncbi:MAG: sugar ABC transporter permease, partial [Pseudomonadota bacterium]